MAFGELLRPEHLAAYHNPASRHSKEAKAILDHLQSNELLLGMKVEILETEPDQRAMKESLSAHTHEGSAVAVASGDGGTAGVLTAALGTRLPVACLLGGNANDLAHILHPRRFLKAPERIFLEGRVAPLRPVLVTALGPHDEMDETYAYGYWGSGTSAETAEEFCDPNTREMLEKIEKEQGRLGGLMRFMKESEICLDGLRGAPYYTITDQKGSRQIVEINVPNGPREAKAFHFPLLRLLRDRAGAFEINHPTISSLGAALGKAACGRMARVDAEHSITFTLEHEDGVLTQADGEVKGPYPTGTTFTVGLAPETVQVYTTRRHTSHA